jgi:hypothetical protein
MGRPEGEKAGIDLIRRIRARSPNTPVYIFCGIWAANNLRDEALKAGAIEITSSGTITRATTQATGSGAEARGGSMPRVCSKPEIASLSVLSVPSLTK